MFFTVNLGLGRVEHSICCFHCFSDQLCSVDDRYLWHQPRQRRWLACKSADKLGHIHCIVGLLEFLGVERREEERHSIVGRSTDYNRKTICEGFSFLNSR